MADESPMPFSQAYNVLIQEVADLETLRDAVKAAHIAVHDGKALTAEVSRLRDARDKLAGEVVEIEASLAESHRKFVAQMDEWSTALAAHTAKAKDAMTALDNDLKTKRAERDALAESIADERTRLEVEHAAAHAKTLARYDADIADRRTTLNAVETQLAAIRKKVGG